MLQTWPVKSNFLIKLQIDSSKIVLKVTFRMPYKQEVSCEKWNHPPCLVSPLPDTWINILV